MSPSGKSEARDAALRRVSQARRWLIAGAIGLTAVFSAVASQAFPGRSLKATTTTTTGTAAPSTSAPAPPADNTLPDDNQAQVPDQSSSPDSSIPPPASIPQPSDSGAGAVSGGS